MNHYTLNTGDNRVSPRDEVGPEILTQLRPLLLDGTHEVPRFPGWSIQSVNGRAGWMGTVYFQFNRATRLIAAPVVSFGLADTEAAAAEIWPLLERTYLQTTDKDPFARADFAAPRQPELPWCAVVLHYPIPADWLGDFERCLAWAWFTRNE